MNHFNSMRPRQNGRHFTDAIFKWIFFSENVRISIKTSRKFVLKDQVNNISALVQIMAWCRQGDKPLSEPMILIYWRIYASLGLNELTWIGTTKQRRARPLLKFAIRYVLFKSANYFKTVRPKRNRQHIGDNILKDIFFNSKCLNFNKKFTAVCW